MDQLNKSSYMMEQRKAKQQFLRDAVMDRDLDPIQFQQFLIEERQNGENIDNWTLNELETMVQRFKLMLMDDKISHISNQDNDNLFKSNLFENNSNENESEIYKLDILEENKVISENNFISEQILNNEGQKSIEKGNTVEHNSGSQNMSSQDDQKKFRKSLEEDYRITIQTFKSPKIINQEIESKIIRSEQKGGGIFSLGRTYTVYLIQTQSLNWEVERRFKDFQSLRAVLLKQYPGYFIPPILNKKSSKEGRDKKRIEFLNIFLRNLTTNSDFVNNPYVQAFLSQKDNNEFQQIQKKGEYLQQITNPMLITTSEGKVDGAISKFYSLFHQGIKQYSHLSQPIYQNLKQLYKQLQNDLINIQSTYSKIGQNYDHLYQINYEINHKLNIQKLGDLSQIYKKLSEFMTKQSNDINIQIQNIEENLYVYTKYKYLQFQSINELVEQRTYQSQEFKKQDLRLKNKKQKLYESKDVRYFDLNPQAYKSHSQEDIINNKDLCFQHMCHSEQKAVNEIKQQFSFYDFNFYKQLNQLIDEKCKFYGNQYMKYSYKNIQTLQNIIIQHKEVQDYLIKSNIYQV